LAITKTHPIKSTMKAAIDYICNPEKTDGSLLISSFGCAPETADLEFAWTRKHAIDKGSNLGRHLIQAFGPGEVSAEEAHEIGKQLADEILKGKYEYVLTTHVDRDHIHNHLIFCSVSFQDHKHYHSNKRSYHEIRRVSDWLCQEHGLSIITPGDAKGKSYAEHRAEQTGTSYKANLKRKIDQLIPVSSDLEDLLCRLQAEGYEIRRGKNLSCKVTEQKYFTCLKNLGIDYTEEAIIHRITGGLRPSKQPKKQDNRISLLIDIQNNLKAQESAGFAHWAKLNNLKQAAKTMNYLTEHGINSYEELVATISNSRVQRNQLLAEIKKAENQLSEIGILQKQASIYRQYRGIYERYKKSSDKEKFLRGNEEKIILFEVAARELKLRGIKKLPTDDYLRSEMDAIDKQKKQLYVKYRTMGKHIKEYSTIMQNIDLLLSPQQKDPAHTHQLE